MSSLEKSKGKDTTVYSAIASLAENDKLDTEKLKELVNLQFQIEERQAKQEFNKAFAAFQAECPVMEKVKKVDFSARSGNRVKYNYCPLEHLVQMIKKPLADNGLSYSFNIKQGNPYYELITTISHARGYSKEFSHFFNPIHQDSKMNLSQQQKSALTYAKRAGLESSLGVATKEEDDDARATDQIPASTDALEELKNIISADRVPRLLDYINKSFGRDYKSINELGQVEALHAIEVSRGNKK